MPSTRRGRASTAAELVRSAPLLVRPPVDPNSADYRIALEALIHIHEQYSEVTVGKGNTERLYLLHGLCEHTFNLANATLLLIDSGHLAATMPLTRVAFEHALAAQWIHAQPDGLNLFLTKAQAEYDRFLKNAVGIPGMPREVKAAFEALPDPDGLPTMTRNFELICKDFDSSGWLYFMYRVLSGPMHPGSSSIQHYVEIQEGSQLPFHLRTQPLSDNSESVIFTLTLSVVLASGVYEDIRKYKPNKAKVRDLSLPLGMNPFPKLIT